MNHSYRCHDGDAFGNHLSAGSLQAARREQAMEYGEWVPKYTHTLTAQAATNVHSRLSLVPAVKKHPRPPLDAGARLVVQQLRPREHPVAVKRQIDQLAP